MQTLKISVDYPADLSDLRMDIYTSGYRKVRELSAGPVLSGKRIVTLQADGLKGLSRGTYFFIVIAKDINGKDDKGAIGKVLILY